ncbi:diuretic hormone 44 [Chelonus insularis]|uniref:diuretic hormone 44 n=1 Tax=Chelonus insularis TaxID=460826 RepID=UPI00158BCE4B|nr:diuretic hormone 44 [Chelonus insularis]XP_034949707.1 diuretic hormone 44 [Chelonus insularis]
MFFVSLLVLTIFISSSKSTPLSYMTYQRRNDIADLNGEMYNTYVPYVVDDRRSASANEVYWPQSSEDDTLKINNSINGVDRVKKLHSLSVSNSLDVLRERVLLELARQKALQDQQQINANRRFLNNIGKRSNVHPKLNLMLDTKKNRILDYTLTDNLEQNNFPIKNLLKRNSYWVNKNELGDQYDEGDDLQEAEMRRINLL